MEHYIRLLTTQLTTYTTQGGHLHITQREATRKIIANADAYLRSIGLNQHAAYDAVVAQVAAVFCGYVDAFVRRGEGEGGTGETEYPHL